MCNKPVKIVESLQHEIERKISANPEEVQYTDVERFLDDTIDKLKLYMIHKLRLHVELLVFVDS